MARRNDSCISLLTIDCLQFVDYNRVCTNRAAGSQCPIDPTRESSSEDECIPLVVFPEVTCWDYFVKSSLIDEESLTDDESTATFLPWATQEPSFASEPMRCDHDEHNDRSQITLSSSGESSQQIFYHVSWPCEYKDTGKRLGNGCCRDEPISTLRRNRSRLTVSKAIIQAEDNSYFTEGFISVGDLPQVT